MSSYLRTRPWKVGVLIVSVLAVSGLMFGTAMASRNSNTTSSPLPCKKGLDDCIDIGYTHAWLGGKAVTLEYSHPYFCANPPASGASSGCETGTPAVTAPPSGAVVSNIYVLIPLGFTPPINTVQCRASCIDQPSTMDLSAIGGDSNATLSMRSFVLEDDESFQSTWWPVVIVGVKTLHAWNRIASRKTIEASDHCQEVGHCLQESDGNAFVFFQVLGPGMSTAGPA